MEENTERVVPNEPGIYGVDFTKVSFVPLEENTELAELKAIKNSLSVLKVGVLVYLGGHLLLGIVNLFI